jgi:hypothetical protein
MATTYIAITSKPARLFFAVLSAARIGPARHTTDESLADYRLHTLILAAILAAVALISH